MTTPAAAITDAAAYAQAVEDAVKASAAYYAGGTSALDDDAYDRLVRGIAAWESEHRDQVLPDSPTGKVADGAVEGDVPHTVAMLSLDNVFSPEEFTAWTASLARRIGHEVERFSVEPKLDGFAVAARYAGGRLSQLITRGDGTAGEDVSHAIGTEIAALRAELPFGIDGIVIKADPAADQQTAGSGSRAPRWAIAYKLPAVEKITRLLEAEWNVGRTGIIAPRAVLEPVEIDGATITYATLHNPADITRRDLRLGDHVMVHRAGDVIPRVEAPVAHLRTGDEQPIAFPEACPRCGAGIDTSEQRWRCENGRNCHLTVLGSGEQVRLVRSSPNCWFRRRP